MRIYELDQTSAIDLYSTCYEAFSAKHLVDFSYDESSSVGVVPRPQLTPVVEQSHL